MKIKAELRVRDGKTVGVMWPFNDDGMPDEKGTKQLEWPFGPAGADGEPKIGDKVYWHLMVKKLCEQPGWSMNGTLSEQQEAAPEGGQEDGEVP